METAALSSDWSVVAVDGDVGSAGSCRVWEPSRPSSNGSITIDRDGIVAVVSGDWCAGSEDSYWGCGSITIDRDGIVAVVSGDGRAGGDDSCRVWEPSRLSSNGSITTSRDGVVTVVSKDGSDHMCQVWEPSRPSSVSIITTTWHGVVAVVGDSGCFSSGGISRWGHLIADGRGVVAVVGGGTDGNSSYSIITADWSSVVFSQVVGVPAVIVEVAPPLPTETETETRLLLSFILFDKQGLNLSIAFTTS